MVSSKFELLGQFPSYANILEKSKKPNVNAKFNSVNIYRYQESEKNIK